jgi:hypothetical protein
VTAESLFTLIFALDESDLFDSRCGRALSQLPIGYAVLITITAKRIVSAPARNRTVILGFDSRAGNFSLYHRVQNGSGAHLASYPMGTRDAFPGGEADNSPLSSAEVKECVGLYIHSPNTPSWRGA